jgi:hypothetical protein
VSPRPDSIQTDAGAKALATARDEARSVSRGRRDRDVVIEIGIAHVNRKLADETDDAWRQVSIGLAVRRQLAETVTGYEADSDVQSLAAKIMADLLGDGSDMPRRK